MVVIAIGPKAKEDEYHKVLVAIAGKELFFVDNYDELEETVDNITAFICRKYCSAASFSTTRPVYKEGG